MYAEIGDISFENDLLQVELASSEQEYTGKITGDSMKFEGEWGKYKGSFELKIHE